MSSFQTALLVALGMIMLVAVLIFAGVIPSPWKSPSGGLGGAVTLWGPIPEDDIQAVLSDFQKRHKDEFTLTYLAKDPRTLESELVEALAAGRGPDLIILPHSAVWKRADLIAPIAYEFLPERQFLDTFSREGGLYSSPNGWRALPLYVDPLVLYYNVDLLSGARLTKPPATWKEVEAAVAVLTKADQNQNLLLSAIPLGRANNLNHFKDIMTLLLLQAGNPVIRFDDAGQPQVTLSEAFGRSQLPAVEALGFFNRFADSRSPLYSWNSSRPEARDAFSRGQAAMYLGLGSEYDLLRRQNPQLNIDAATVPQISSAAALTVGRLSGVSLLRASRNPETARQVALLLASAEFAGPLAQALGVAPARNDLLRAPAPGNAVAASLYQSAILSRGFLEPDGEQVEAIFRRMAEQAQSGQRTPVEAVEDADRQLESLVPRAAARGIGLWSQLAAPLVPCSGEDCNWDKLFELFQNILNWFILIAVPVAAIAIAYAGWLMIWKGTNEGSINEGKRILWSVLLGLVFVLAAALLVKSILAVLAQPEFKDIIK